MTFQQRFARLRESWDGTAEIRATLRRHGFPNSDLPADEAWILLARAFEERIISPSEMQHHSLGDIIRLLRCYQRWERQMVFDGFRFQKGEVL